MTLTLVHPWALTQPTCCSRYNVDCQGHQPEDQGPRWPGAELTSPGYCDHQSAGWPLFCQPGCQHPECLNPPF